MGTCDLPDIYALWPAAFELQEYTSDKSQLLHIRRPIARIIELQQNVFIATQLRSYN